MSNWDDDVKKYRAKRMSVSGHAMQPAFVPKPAITMIAITDMGEDGEESMSDDSDDDRISYGDSIQSVQTSNSSQPAPSDTSRKDSSSSGVVPGDYDTLPVAPPPPPSSVATSGILTPQSTSSQRKPGQPDPSELPALNQYDDGEIDNHWIELEGKYDKDFVLYINTKTNQSTHVKPIGYTPPERQIVRGGADLLSISPTGDNAQEKLRQGVQHISRYIDQQLITNATQVGDQVEEELERIRVLLEKLQSNLAAQSVSQANNSVLNVLIGYDQFQWDFNHQTSQEKMNYYRAAALVQTDHDALLYSNWHLPEYFSNQPLLATSVKKTVSVHLPAQDAEGLPPHRPRRTLIDVKLDDLTDVHLINAVGILYDKSTNPNDFVFKVIGHREYLDFGKLFWSYHSVRKSIRDNIDLELALVRRPEPIQLTQVQQEQLQTVRENYISLVKPQAQAEVLSKDTFADLVDVTNASFDQMSTLTHIPVASLNVPFSVHVVGLDNLNVDSLPRFSSDIVSVYMRVTLLHGVVELPFQFETQSQDINETLLINETLYGGPQSLLSILPRETRIAYMLYGRTKEDDRSKDIQLGAVVNQIFNERGHLLSGQTAHYVWAFPASSGRKQVGGKRYKDPLYLFRCQNYDNHTKGQPKCIIRVKYPQFTLPVVAPLVARYYEPNARMVGLELKRPLDKVQSQLLIKIIHSDPLFELTPENKQLLWNARHYLVDVPAALPKILNCVDWSRIDYRNEAYRLLRIWALPANPVEVIGLLDASYADYRVREYAVEHLKALNDEDLQLYLLQMVQCIKYEPYHDSPLSRFLIERAINSPYQVGHTLFWHLKAEVHDPTICERFTCILEELLSHIGPFTDDLFKQVLAVTQLQKVAEHVYRMKREFSYSDEESTVHYHQKLHELNEKVFGPQGKFQIPLSPVTEATTLIVEKCRFMSSKMVPLWLVFKNADPAGPPIFLIFKSGDDLRQDLLTLQILRIMDRLWLQQGLDMRLKPYNVIATGVNDIGEGVGMIEVVLNSTTTSDIQLTWGGGVRGALKLDPIDLYLRHHNNDPTSYGNAVSNFIQSCAGYCVATYVLGIGDRHNGNIMVTKSGHLFHIDFGHFLGNFKKKFGMNRERAAFVFTPEMAFVMGGREYKRSEMFRQFKQNCTKSFRVLRQNAALLEYLFTLVIAAGMPELNESSHILYLRHKLDLDVDPKIASRALQDEVKKAVESTSRRLDNLIHNWKHG
jgi:phosphatidylinositol-4,5-bisphosphate 3-kinase